MALQKRRFLTGRVPARAWTTPDAGVCAKNGIFEPFIYKMHHFAKTGSGQT
jgi:hypothetical protein